MKNLKRIVFSLMVLVLIGGAGGGCAQQNFKSATAFNGLPIRIDTKTVVGFIENGNACQIYMKNAVVFVLRNCDEFIKSLESGN